MAGVDFSWNRVGDKYVCIDCGALITGLGSFGHHADGTPCDRELFYDPAAIERAQDTDMNRLFRAQFAENFRRQVKVLGAAIRDSGAKVK